MSGEIGAAGDLATGMLVARAVESQVGEHAHRGSAHGLCLNCGTALRGDFCHACGQAGHVHRTLVSIGHDLLHGVFHFEGKVWRTLPMLVLRPGELTRRFVAGERARFVSPLALFLFSVFLMFAVLHSGGSEEASETLTPAQRAAAVAKADIRIAELERELAENRAVAKPPPGKIVSLESQLMAERMRRNTEADRRGPTFTDLHTNWHALDNGIAKANANPSLAIYKLQSSAYKYSWALIPISVPLVALLFAWRRRFKLYDHAIFVTYSLSFMMFLVVAITVSGMVNAPSWIAGTAFWLVPPVHMFFQLRGAYSLRKRSALWRTAVLLMFAGIALVLFIALLLVLGLMD